VATRQKFRELDGECNPRVQATDGSLLQHPLGLRAGCAQTGEKDGQAPAKTTVRPLHRDDFGRARRSVWHFGGDAIRLFDECGHNL